MTPPEIPPAVPAGDDDSPAVARIQSRVDAAAFALLREGKNPTVALVRDRMGGGSPNRVAPALQKWRLGLAGQLDANAGSGSGDPTARCPRAGSGAVVSRTVRSPPRASRYNNFY